MKNKNVYLNKNILVCGMARSGISSAVLLAKLGAEVTLQDAKTRDEIKPQDIFAEIEKHNISLFLGRNPDDIVARFDLVVVSPGIPCYLPFFGKAKELGVELIGEIELAYRLCPCRILAVTGTNGKTTTTALLGEIMRRHKSGSVTVGNIGAPFTDKVIKLNEDAFAVAELSSFQLETVKEFKPKVAVMLNITPDHLNRHRTMENYISAKENIFKNQAENDFAVLNYNDTYCREMAGRIKSTRFRIR